jgi:type IV pilus assembly protein PilA
MLQRLRHRAQGQEGFTLIELLVVILIIGILAAVAIPAFLNQKGKATDANVKSDINSAQTALETYYTDNQTYVLPTGVNPDLTNIEPTLTNAVTNESLAVSGASTTGYTITAKDGTTAAAITFNLIKGSTGVLSRTCTVPSGTNPAGCKNPNSAGVGSW